MISVFQIFKIILGVIVAAFILVFLVNFAISYGDISETGKQVSTIVSFKKTIEDVYTTSIETDFKFKDSAIIGYNPPYIITEATANVDFEPIPIMLVPGKSLSIHRNEYDLKWWKFLFIQVLPETKILFVPPNNQEKTWLAAGNITRFFPSTENTEAKVKFGLGCEGNDYWLGPQRYKFLTDTLPKAATADLVLNLCENTEHFEDKGIQLVVISENMEDVDFLVIPKNNDIGHVYIKTDEGYEDYLYKNGLDVVALFLGGGKLYRYMNQKFLKELEVAIDLRIRESELLLGDYDIQKRCDSEFSEFTSTLTWIKDLIPKLDLNDEDYANEFNLYLKKSVQDYRALERMGCG